MSKEEGHGQYPRNMIENGGRDQYLEEEKTISEKNSFLDTTVT